MKTMEIKEKLKNIPDCSRQLNSWAEKIIKGSIIVIMLILILSLWIFILNFLLNKTSISQLYAGAFYVIFYLVIWGILPALGIRFGMRVYNYLVNRNR